LAAKIDSTLNTETVLKELNLYRDWCTKCLEIHQQAWNNTKHDGFRAKAYEWNKKFLEKYSQFKTMSSAEIVTKLKEVIFDVIPKSCK
jgi:hypothetical protein